MKLLRGFERKIKTRAAESADARGRIGFDDAHDAKFFFASDNGNARSARGHHAIENVLITGVFRKDGAFCVAKSQFLANKRGGLIREHFCKLNLQDGFLGGWRRKIGPGHAFKSAAGARRIRKSENAGRFRFTGVADVRGEADLRIDFRDARELADLKPRVLVKSVGILFGR